MVGDPWGLKALESRSPALVATFHLLTPFQLLVSEELSLSGVKSRQPHFWVTFPRLVRGASLSVFIQAILPLTPLSKINLSQACRFFHITNKIPFMVL